MFQRVGNQPLRPPLVRFTDGLLRAIAEDLASVPPERGGAILGYDETGHLLVTDTFGAYSPASWLISAQLSTAVGRLENLGYGTLRGTVHTHPSGFVDPSGPDVATTTKALEMNPHLDELIIAVVTAGQPRPYDAPIGQSHRMSVHVLRRQGAGAPVLLRARVAVHPVASSLEHAGLLPTSLISVDDALADGFNGTALPVVFRADGRETLLIPVPETAGSALLIDSLFPTVSPLAVRTTSSSGGASLTTLPSSWDPTREPAEQLASMASSVRDLERGERWTRITAFTGSLAEKRVIVVGAGSVGSRIAEDLVRCGVHTITLIDPDEVSVSNLARSVYTQVDIGKPKVVALSHRLRDIDPAVTVAAHQAAISALEPEEVLPGADLVVLATDDMQEQAFLAHWAYHLDIPHVAAAMYKKGAAGEVVIVVPSAGTPCWNCCVGAGTRSGAQRPDANYGLQGRLVGESALGPSINIVTSVASQLSVGLLAGPGSAAGAPLGRLVAEHRTLGLISTSPEWDFFPQVFVDMAHQHEPQSIWPSVEAGAGCPVCGTERQAPFTRSEGSRFLSELLELQAAEAQA